MENPNCENGPDDRQAREDAQSTEFMASGRALHDAAIEYAEANTTAKESTEIGAACREIRAWEALVKAAGVHADAVRQPQRESEKESRWQYQPYRATLLRDGERFAIVTPNGRDAMRGEDAEILLEALNRSEGGDE